jgi:hypothetical protein
LVPLVFVPVNAITAAPNEEEKTDTAPSMVTVTVPVPAPLETMARQAWIRRATVLKICPPAVPISVNVNPAPVTLVTLGATSVPTPQSVPLAQAVDVKTM